MYAGVGQAIFDSSEWIPPPPAKKKIALRNVSRPAKRSTSYATTYGSQTAAPPTSSTPAPAEHKPRAGAPPPASTAEEAVMQEVLVEPYVEESPRRRYAVYGLIAAVALGGGYLVYRAGRKKGTRAQ